VSAAEKYVLRLYVTGMTPRSMRAVETVRALCRERLDGRHELEIVDVYQQPARISEDQIFAIPTLVRVQPTPLRRIIGDMSNRERLLWGLGLPEATLAI
jgi:circadian clock protein KaiB